MKFFVFIVMALSESCAIGTGVSEFIGPDGTKEYEAKCNGWARSMSDCYAQATETCDGPYVVSGKTFSPKSPIVNREIRFSCK